MAEANEERKEANSVQRIEIGSNEARRQLTDLVNRVAYSGRRVVITRHGKPYAALIGPQDLEKLEASEAPAGAA